ncbi:MAG: hypothetical protein Rhims3KO_20800 [Hyphomicrobiales bacterium]
MSQNRPKKAPETKDDKNPMSADAFRHWRKRLGLKQKDAADLLGLKKRMIQYYETGSRDGKHVSIPQSIRLACYALEAGVGDYDGEKVLTTATFTLSGPVLTDVKDEVEVARVEAVASTPALNKAMALQKAADPSTDRGTTTGAGAMLIQPLKGHK